MWLLWRVPRSAGHAAPPPQGLHATTPGRAWSAAGATTTRHPTIRRPFLRRIIVSSCYLLARQKATFNHGLLAEVPAVVAAIIIWSVICSLVIQCLDTQRDLNPRFSERIGNSRRTRRVGDPDRTVSQSTVPPSSVPPSSSRSDAGTWPTGPGPVPTPVSRRSAERSNQGSVSALIIFETPSAPRPRNG